MVVAVKGTDDAVVNCGFTLDEIVPAAVTVTVCADVHVDAIGDDDELG